MTYGTVGAVACLAYFSVSWVFWTFVTVGMLVVFGPRHPRVFDEDVPLDRARTVLAILAIVLLVVCFTPVPMKLDFIGTR